MNRTQSSEIVQMNVSEIWRKPGKCEGESHISCGPLETELQKIGVSSVIFDASRRRLSGQIVHKVRGSESKM